MIVAAEVVKIGKEEGDNPVGPTIEVELLRGNIAEVLVPTALLSEGTEPVEREGRTQAADEGSAWTVVVICMVVVIVTTVVKSVSASAELQLAVAGLFKEVLVTGAEELSSADAVGDVVESELAELNVMDGTDGTGDDTNELLGPTSGDVTVLDEDSKPELGSSLEDAESEVVAVTALSDDTLVSGVKEISADDGLGDTVEDSSTLRVGEEVLAISNELDATGGVGTSEFVVCGMGGKEVMYPVGEASADMLEAISEDETGVACDVSAVETKVKEELTASTVDEATVEDERKVTSDGISETEATVEELTASAVDEASADVLEATSEDKEEEASDDSATETALEEEPTVSIVDGEITGVTAPIISKTLVHEVLHLPVASTLLLLASILAVIGEFSLVAKSSSLVEPEGMGLGAGELNAVG